MAKQHAKTPFLLFTLAEYVETIVSFLERLNPEIIIQRLAGEAPMRVLLAPRWGKRNTEVLHYIHKEFEKRDTWQGKFYKKRKIRC
jgi:radical SAM superfamily enzyme